MASIRLNDGEVGYQVDGEPGKPWLMFSNSLGTDLRMWQAQADFFKQNFRVLRYDTRGHGGSTIGPPAAAAAAAAASAAASAAAARERSGRDDDDGRGAGLAAGLRAGRGPDREPVTLERLGRDVLGLLDALDIERVHFCGLSMGGAIAQWLGIHAPQRLHKLVIANSAPRIGTAQGWQDRAALVRASGLDAIADGAAGRWFTPAFAEREPRRVAALVAALRTGNPEGYAACCDALAAADLRGQLATIPVPTLLIAGAADPVTTVADATAMRDQIPGAALAILDASHISNIEAETAFNLALREFLQS